MRKKVFLTGATGTMGFATLTALLSEPSYDIIIIVRDTKDSHKRLRAYQSMKNVTIYYGDLTHYSDVLACMSGVDIVLHCAAFVSPEADDFPKEAMAINYGSTVNIINAIKAQPNAQQIRFVWIGSIAQTGDRMPPIHWGRVGDPLKPSVHDYYAVSKIAAERAVIESGLKYWVSLRQTGILSEKMSKISDAIIFHNGLDNVLEYVTEHDSGKLMANCCKNLPDEFWGHIYNIGGGESCRMSCHEMFVDLFGLIGFKNLENILNAQWFAVRNFHGHYYLDSDKLEDFLHFRSQGKAYFFEQYLKTLGLIVPLSKAINKLPGGEKFMGKLVRKRFERHLHEPRGTLNWIHNNIETHIEPFFISKDHWNQLESLNRRAHYTDFDKVVHIDHGYDETKPESALTLEVVQGAAEFRGGKCLSEVMTKGDWQTQLKWQCAFGHEFEASPRLILEGGHWCPECERASWNYHAVAKVNPFFAQVWYPLHAEDEPERTYPKLVTELN